MKITNRSLLAGRVVLRALAITLIAGVASVANAQIVFDSVNGSDVASDNGSAPTSLPFSVGSNIVNGAVSSSIPDNTRNFFTFTIGEGQELSAIVVDALTSTDDNPGFYALVDGNTSFAPGLDDEFEEPGANLGGELHNPGLVGDDLLALIAGGGISGGTGFDSIGAGDYTFVIQQTGSQVSTFSLDFQVSDAAVPEPTSGLLLVGLGVAGLARRRRR